jgi:hypothetical protein
MFVLFFLFLQTKNLTPVEFIYSKTPFLMVYLVHTIGIQFASYIGMVRQTTAPGDPGTSAEESRK